MAIKFTDDQRKAIDAKGTVLVAAAAGSGKTAVLTERVVQRICDPKDPASIDRMLIVTFTNASALEMRVRIGKKIDEYIHEHPSNTNAYKQKLLLRSAKICTIDSFCGDLVRHHFGQLGINPDFSVATDAQTSALKERALKEVLAKRFLEPDDDFNTLCETFKIYNGDRDLREAVLSVYNFSLCMSRPEHWMRSSVDYYFVDKINNSPFSEVIYKKSRMKLLTARDNAEMILRECVGTEFESAWYQGFSDTVEHINTTLKAVEDKDWDRLYDLANQFEKTSVETVRKPKDEALRETMKRIRDKIYKDIRSICDDQCGPEAFVLDELRITGRQVKSLVDIVIDFSKKYLELLLSKNILTFALIEQFALKLLCTDTPDGLVPSELSKEVCKLYDEVLVDEYQDNNDLQDALFNAVSDNGSHLFMVGDVKQSIYGFRNANPDNFLKHKNDYKDYDGVTSPSKVILNANFRSRSGVCDFVNGIFKTLMQNDTCGMEYGDDEVLKPDAEYLDNTAPKAELNIVRNLNGINREIADAEAVADYIAGVLKEEPFLRNGKTELRRAEYKDFAILLRYPRNRVKYYIEALKKRGIPAAFDSGEFFTSTEVMTAMSVLRAVNNPLLDIPLLAAMTSVAFGFTFDEVAKIKASCKGVNLYARIVKAADNGDSKCHAMLETLSVLRKKAVTMSVGAFVNEVYRVTYIKEILSSYNDGIQKNANLSSLVSMANDYDSFSNGGLAGFIDYFDRSAAERSSGSKTVGGDVNAVKIMSFHGSKGLQFPICIVAGCGNGFNLEDLKKPIITNGTYGIGMSFVSDGVKHSTVARNVLKEAHLLKIISEEIRLLYVAMTRAEERLMLSLSLDDLNKEINDAITLLGLSAFDTNKIPAQAVLSAIGYKTMVLCSALMQADGVKLTEAVGLPALGFGGEGSFKLTVSDASVFDEGAVDELDKFKVNDIDPNVQNMLSERFDYVYPDSALCKIPSKIAVTELVHGDSEQYAFKARPRFMSKAGLTPAERGTALHKFMQYASFDNAEKDVEAEVQRLYEYEFISEEEADSIDRDLLKRFFKSKLYARIKSADKVWREYKFMVSYPYNGQKTIIQGIADCMFQENGKIVIVDFKTDNVNDMSVLIDRYSQQLQIYKEAISEIFDLPVGECLIYSVKLGADVNV